jgi:hypothetical protein
VENHSLVLIQEAEALVAVQVLLQTQEGVVLLGIPPQQITEVRRMAQ